MILRQLDSSKRVLVVAEIGNNHEGDFNVAERLVIEASRAGADAVKVQVFVPELFVRPEDTVRLAQLSRYRLSFDQFRALGDTARDAGLAFIATPLDLCSAEFVARHCDGLKIASGDNDFVPLLEFAGASGLPVLVSTGLATIPEVRRACEIVRAARRRAQREAAPPAALPSASHPGSAFVAEATEMIGPSIATAPEIGHRVPADAHGSIAPASLLSGDGRTVRRWLGVLHCVSSYPVQPQFANLAAIRTLEREIDATIGYSDHVVGIDAAALSAAAGARIVEKHFTLDKARTTFRDHALSADPADLRELIRRIREMSVLLGDGAKKPQPPEAELARALRRSIVAARDLEAGDVLRSEDLLWQRPGGGLPPGDEGKLIGRQLRYALRRGDNLTLDAVEAESGACESLEAAVRFRSA